VNGARLLKQARDAGLELRVSPAGKLACRGPADQVERFKPALVENRDALIAELLDFVAFDPERLQREADRRNADAASAHQTDRFCSCRKLATNTWPDARRRPVWRCDDCAPTRGRA